jgi:hypothetical protein
MTRDRLYFHPDYPPVVYPDGVEFYCEPLARQSDALEYMFKALPPDLLTNGGRVLYYRFYLRAVDYYSMTIEDIHAHIADQFSLFQFTYYDQIDRGAGGKDTHYSQYRILPEFEMVPINEYVWTEWYTPRRSWKSEVPL